MCYHLPVYVSWLVVKCVIKGCCSVHHVAPRSMQYTLHKLREINIQLMQKLLNPAQLEVPLASLCCHLCTKGTMDPLHPPIPHHIWLEIWSRHPERYCATNYNNLAMLFTVDMRVPWNIGWLLYIITSFHLGAPATKHPFLLAILCLPSSWLTDFHMSSRDLVSAQWKSASVDYKPGYIQ